MLQDDYWGHVFWDQETWMYPPILMFRPDLAKMLLYTRKRTMEGARENAKIKGHQGLQFPWESARSGGDDGSYNTFVELIILSPPFHSKPGICFILLKHGC